ncbi:Ankyrin repeat domain-containing protein [Plasmodiophora brassicae]
MHLMGTPTSFRVATTAFVVIVFLYGVTDGAGRPSRRSNNRIASASSAMGHLLHAPGIARLYRSAGTNPQKAIVNQVLNNLRAGGTGDLTAINDQPWDSLGNVLNWAARENQTLVAEMLLNCPGINVRIPDVEDGMTPLRVAAERGHVEIVALLLSDPGVDVNAQDKLGKTPLLAAASEGHVDVVTLLIRANGINVDACDYTGTTPLLIAASRGHVDVVALLVHVSKMVNAKDEDGMTALHAAASAGDVEIVELLLNVSGINVNARDKEGMTPLHYAAADGQADVIRVLLKVEGVLIWVKDVHDRAPLDWALGRRDAEELLLAARNDDPVMSGDDD